MTTRTQQLEAAARKLVNNVEHDMNGTMGKGGNGGLTSDTTLRAAHEVQAILNRADELPQEVINLVIAAREFWDANNDLSEESTALGKALEAFSSRVPYDNDPDDEAEVTQRLEARQ